MRNGSVDAVVVGAGPNGLAAAIALAASGLRTIVYEANETIGGGARSGPLTIDGFTHDLCSAVHPLAVGSPYFRTLPLDDHGLEWVRPEVELAHPFDGGDAAVVSRSIEATAEGLGRDEQSYLRLLKPFEERWWSLASALLGPLRIPPDVLTAIRFGMTAWKPARRAAQTLFETERARALFAGLAAHSNMPLTSLGSAAFGMILGASAHAVGWPMPRRGAQSIADALGSHFRSLGGEIHCGTRVRSMDDLPLARAYLFDLTPRQVLSIAEDRLPAFYKRSLSRFRYGPGTFKIDWALSEPIPWAAQHCRHAGTVHLGGTLDEIVTSEQAAAEGEHSDRPFVLLTQPSLFDPTRAPRGRHTAWAYCHTPFGSSVDLTDLVEKQIERFAPGFRDCILARVARTAASAQKENQNLVGGDINGGSLTGLQLIFRPALRLVPYATPNPRIFFCSSSTPPGAGVHGMCGYHAARTVISHVFGRRGMR